MSISLDGPGPFEKGQRAEPAGTFTRPPSSETATVTVLRPAQGWRPIDFGEIWHYRELLAILAARDIKVRYKQTALGAAWAILQPVLTMIVFSLIFGRLAGIPSDGVPYPLFSFCGLLPWQLFASSLTQAGNSLVGNQNLITKVYFPRILIPASSMIAALVDFAIAFGVLIGMMLWYGVVPSVAILALPFFLLLAFMTALAAGLWLSALNVEYRDIRYVIPFLTQFWMFVTPIVYPSSLVPERWRWAIALNPMTGVVDGFRWCLLGVRPPPGGLLALSVAVVALFLLGGLLYFRRMERTFADLI